MNAEEDDEEAPDLEEVDQEELERTKQQKQKEWLDKVVASHADPNQITEKSAKIESQDEPKDETEAHDDPKADDKEDEVDDEEDIDAILSDEKRVREAQAAVTADQIQVFIEEQADAVQKKKGTGTDFDELD